MKLLIKIWSRIPVKNRLQIRIFISKIFKKTRWEKDRQKIFQKQMDCGVNNIPIFIISYNRLSYVKKTIEWLENGNIKNIIIIDNNSKYEPLLQYYKSIPYKIIYMEKNSGHKVFWENDIFKKYRDNFYAVTDPDLIPVDECPDDFMEYFFNILRKYNFVRKVGFSLKIDDLPSDNKFSKEVIEWESQYYKVKISSDNIYYGSIDTTFALYIPDSLVKHQSFYSAFRVGFPYQAKHLPWYKNENAITEEDIFYSQNRTNGWWDNVKDNVTPDDLQWDNVKREYI